MLHFQLAESSVEKFRDRFVSFLKDTLFCLVSELSSVKYVFSVYPNSNWYRSRRPKGEKNTNKMRYKYNNRSLNMK